MKDLKKITVNSLFNSIQFLKLYLNRFKIFLITLLSLILLFSISCKSNEEPKEEIDKNRLIPSEWWGEYEIIDNKYDAVSPATVNSNRVTYSRTYYISNYIGKNTWYCGNQYSYKNIYNEFFSNEKGQRIFYEILEDRKYTNTFVHKEDSKK